MAREQKEMQNDWERRHGDEYAPLARGRKHRDGSDDTYGDTYGTGTCDHDAYDDDYFNDCDTEYS